MKRLMTADEKEFYVFIGGQIKAQRRAFNLTQKVIAGHLGVSRGHVACMEAGIYRISLWQLEQIKEVGIVVKLP